MKSIDDKVTTIESPIVAKAYIGNHLSLMLTSTNAEVSGRKMMNPTPITGKATVKNEAKTFIATKNDEKHIALINVCLL